MTRGNNKRKYYAEPNASKRTRYGRQACRGMKGILVTCARNRERQCAREAIDLFTHLLEEKFPRKDEVVSENSTCATQSVSDALASELQQLRETSTSTKSSEKSRIIQLDCGTISGLVMLQLPDADVDPLKLVCAAFDKVRSEKTPQTRNCSRILPFGLSTFPDLDELMTAAPEYLSQTLTDVEQGNSFAIEIHTRSNKKMKRSDSITALASIMTKLRPDMTVNLSDPDTLLLVQVVYNVVLLAIYPARIYERYDEFNMSFVIDKLLGVRPPDSKKKKPNAKKLCHQTQTNSVVKETDSVSTSSPMTSRHNQSAASDTITNRESCKD